MLPQSTSLELAVERSYAITSRSATVGRLFCHHLHGAVIMHGAAALSSPAERGTVDSCQPMPSCFELVAAIQTDSFVAAGQSSAEGINDRQGRLLVVLQFGPILLGVGGTTLRALGRKQVESSALGHRGLRSRHGRADATCLVKRVLFFSSQLDRCDHRQDPVTKRVG